MIRRELSTLVILAAGLGSRYGSAKQMEEFTESRRMLMEFSIHDALLNGFQHIIIVTRKELKKKLEMKLAWVNSKASLTICLQNSLAKRDKPLGTAHAVLSSQIAVSDSFLLINADDYYGKKMFNLARENFKSLVKKNQAGILPYSLHRTLSKNGPVSRAICKFEEDKLVSLKEWKGLTYESIMPMELSINDYVSMNAWVFHIDIFGLLQEYWELGKEKLMKSNEELQLPEFIKWTLIQQKIEVCHLGQGEEWFGITYLQDKVETEEQLSLKLTMHEYAFFD